MNSEDRALFFTLSDEQAIALTVYGEARNQRMRGKVAVAFVILNRAQLWQKPIKEICYSRDFECWHSDNINYPILKAVAKAWAETTQKDQALRACILAAQAARCGNLLSNVPGCTFYKVIGCKSPWFEKQVRKGKFAKVCTIGDHEFYRETKGETCSRNSA